MRKTVIFHLVTLAAAAAFGGSTAFAHKPAAGAVAIEAGPIWNQRDAETKCAAAARDARGLWTGRWWTTVPGRMSVCEVKDAKGPAKAPPVKGGPKVEKHGPGTWTVEAGPLFNQVQAGQKCLSAARGVGGTWTGQWWTTQPGRMSVCEFKRP